MYSKEEYHEYDYSCEICGKGYFAEVGFSIGCGNHTQKEIVKFFEQKKIKEEQEAQKEKARRRRMKKSYQYEDIDIQMEDDDMREF
jgi:uncharacterized Zn finger protein (UPF0148 family)